MGAGMSRILALSLSIASSPGGMVMVDEIENGLHYTVMEKVWQAIAAFASSLRCADFCHHPQPTPAFSRPAGPLRRTRREPLQLYSLGIRKGKMSAVKYDRERLEFAFEVGLGVI